MNRVEGYYWCKLNGKWDIFTWCNAWYDGMENKYNEIDFEKIDERMISRKTNKSKYPSYCCQECGEPIGWLGRFIEFIYCGLIKHNCKFKIHSNNFN